MSARLTVFLLVTCSAGCSLLLPLDDSYTFGEDGGGETDAGMRDAGMPNDARDAGGSDAGTPLPAEEATLLASNAAQDDWFGWSVALSGDGIRALVGAPYDDTAAGENAGTARVFLRTGDTWTEEATLLHSDGVLDLGDSFGYAVALSADGSRALVGVPFDDTALGGMAGSARVFVRSGTTWTEEATLQASDAEAGDTLGISVALSSDGILALVGMPADDAVRGSARVFLRTGTTWARETTLQAPDGAAGDTFGTSVALSSDGSRALVGAYDDDTAGGAGAGSARVFLRIGPGAWNEEATLLASDGAADDSFGASVALSADGSRALVGSPRDATAGGAATGSVRAFLRTGTTWTEEATLLAPDAAAGDGLGSSVALSGDGSRALAGASGDDTASSADAGSVRVFIRTGTTWMEEWSLLPPDGAAGDNFGWSVALSSDGSRGLVGVRFDDTPGGTDAGSARVFTLP